MSNLKEQEIMKQYIIATLQTGTVPEGILRVIYGMLKRI